MKDVTITGTVIVTGTVSVTGTVINPGVPAFGVRERFGPDAIPAIVGRDDIPVLPRAGVGFELIVIGLLVGLFIFGEDLFVMAVTGLGKSVGFEGAEALDMTEDVDTLELDGLGILDAFGAAVTRVVVDPMGVGGPESSSDGMSSVFSDGIAVVVLLAGGLVALVAAAVVFRFGRYFNILSNNGVPIPVTGSHPGTASQPAFSTFAAFQPE
jgi:hypothetical protein